MEIYVKKILLLSAKIKPHPTSWTLTSSSSSLQGIMQTSLPSALASSVGSPNLGEQLKSEVVCNRYVFTTTRQQHQQRTANQALFDLYKLLTQNH